MAKIELTGQAITVTNYTTPRIFNFNPEYIRKVADTFELCGINKIEIPEGVLNPEGQAEDGIIDRKITAETVKMIPDTVTVLGSYFGGPGSDNFLNEKKAKLDAFLELFPKAQYTMLHPAGAKSGMKPAEAVKLWDELASYAAEKQEGFQCCLHNHYDSTCETAEQVRAHLDAIRDIGNPALRWAPDTGHCHGMKDDYLDVLRDNADLVGNYFHIKAQVIAFDELHGGDEYAPERDIWGNKAEFGRGLYGGFVNAADPEVRTPFAEVFEIIRGSRPDDETIYGAMEIDYPRQHPVLEVLCEVLYMKTVHNVKPGIDYSNDELAQRIFKLTAESQSAQRRG